jgi:hypothetical protein
MSVPFFTIRAADRAGIFLPGKYPRNLSIALIRWGKFIPRAEAKTMKPEEFFDNSIVQKIQTSGFIEQVNKR